MKTAMSEELIASDRLVLPEEARREAKRPLRLDWYYTVGVIFMHLAALLAFMPWFFSWTGLLLVPLGMYVFGTLGVCIGFHRLLTHRSFTCPRWLERTLVLIGTCSTLMESPAYWVAIHRRHHQFADEERDPHSPRESFF